MNTTQDSLTTVLQLGGDPADMAFWDGCRRDHFLLHRCDVCHRHYWPASRCIEHGATAMEWVKSSGRGQLYTYTIMHRVFLPEFKERAPYAVAVVQLDEGPFFHSNLVDCDLEDIAVGMRLKTVMQPHSNGLVIPFFTPE